MSTTKESILSQAEVVRIPIDSVEEHPENARIGDLEVIKASLKRFGQVKPIIVQDSTNYVIAGNNVRKALADMGDTEVDAIRIDVDNETAKAYLLADNRASDKATYNEQKLVDSLSGLIDLEGTGWDIDEVETLGDALGGATVDGPQVEVTKIKAEEPGVKDEGESPSSSKPKAKKPEAEPVRDIVMLMTVSEAAAFGQNVAKLQKAYELKTMKDTVVKAVEEQVNQIVPVVAV